MGYVSRPLFSVVIPFYNAEDYLSGAIESIISQTYSQFEIVLVDDGSTDDSVNIAKWYKDECACCLTIVSQANQGPMAARLLGASLAKGEYLVFVDADDSLYSDALEIVHNSLSDEKADIVIFKATSSKWQFHTGACRSASPSYSMNKARQLLISTFELNALWGKAIRRELFVASAKVLAQNEVRYGEDLFQQLPLFDAATSVTFIDKRLYKYRRNPLGGGSSISKTRLMDISFVREQLMCYADRWGIETFPYLHINNCLEVLQYAFDAAVARKSRDERLNYVDYAASSDLLLNSVRGLKRSNFSLLDWIGIRLLLLNKTKQFMAYAHGVRGIKRLYRMVKER